MSAPRRPRERPSDATDDRLATALDQFRACADAEKKQRQAELDDLEFVDLLKQWTPDAEKLRKGTVIGNIPIAARPMLTIDKLGAPIRQVVNQARTAKLGVNLRPKDSDASQQTAEMLEGLYRNIEVQSRANLARMWAFARAAKCGRGYYRILKDYANDGDFDLDLTIKRILNQHSVYLDPFHQEPDGSDADYAFIIEDMPVSRYRRLYPTKADGAPSLLAGMDDQELASIGDDAPEWVNGDGATKTVRVAEWFYAEYTTTFLIGATYQGQTIAGLEEELPTGATPIPGMRRPVEKRTIQWCKINAVEVLDEQDWQGRYIPIVQVLGEEVNVNGERAYKGIVRAAKDAQRFFNYTRSSEAETIGVAPKTPWLVVDGQLEGFERLWQQANVRNFPWLPYRQVNVAGQPAAPPQRNIAEPPIQAVSQASREAAYDLQGITGGYAAASGDALSPQQSGKAIQALQQASEQGMSNYLQDFADISLVHEARIILDLVPYVYDKPGRILQILTGDDDTAKSVMVNRPYVPGPNGQPQAVPPGPASPQPGQPPAAQTPGQIHHDLTKGQYAVTVDIGKAFSTRKQEAVAMMGELMQAAPQTVPLWADIFVRNLDIPGGNEIAERLTPPQFQKGPDGQAVPPDPEKQQLQQQLQVLTQQLQQAQAGIAAKQIQAESNEKIAAAKLQSDQQIAAIKADIDRLKVSAQVGMKQQELAVQQHGQALAQAAEDTRHARDMAHEAATNVADAGHEAHLHAVDLHHQQAMAQTAHVHAKDLQASAPVPPSKGG